RPASTALASSLPALSTPENYTLSLHDALPILKGLSLYGVVGRKLPSTWERTTAYVRDGVIDVAALITHSFPMHDIDAAIELMKSDRKSTRLNSSHVKISYAVFCLKKKKTKD